jgi:hypothetical protein
MEPAIGHEPADLPTANLCSQPPSAKAFQAATASVVGKSDDFASA